MRLDSYSDSSILSSTIQWATPGGTASLPLTSELAPAQNRFAAPIETPIENQVEVRLLSQILWFWAEQPDTGFVLSQEKHFQLSTGQVCTPMVAWISRDRWQQLAPEQQVGLSPICPNFVVEMRRLGDSFYQLNQQMEGYLQESGMQLGWLIDCETQSLCIYRPDRPVICLSQPELVSTAPILPGFVLDWRSLW